MGIVREEPVKNMDTDEPLRMPPPDKRVTRALLHRTLKKAGIKHDAGGSLQDMLDVMRLNNVPFDPPTPGPLEDNVIDIAEEEDIQAQIERLQERLNNKKAPEKTIILAKDGFPQNMGQLKGLCKKRGIPIGQKDTRDILVGKLRGHHGQNFT